MRISPGTPNGGITESDTAELYPELARALAPLDLAYLHVMEFGHREVTEAVRAAWPNALLLNPHPDPAPGARTTRSEEHTSELQSRENLVCRLLLEKKYII